MVYSRHSRKHPPQLLNPSRVAQWILWFPNLRVSNCTPTLKCHQKTYQRRLLKPKSTPASICHQTKSTLRCHQTTYHKRLLKPPEGVPDWALEVTPAIIRQAQAAWDHYARSSQSVPTDSPTYLSVDRWELCWRSGFPGHSSRIVIESEVGFAPAADYMESCPRIAPATTARTPVDNSSKPNPYTICIINRIKRSAVLFFRVPPPTWNHLQECNAISCLNPINREPAHTGRVNNRFCFSFQRKNSLYWISFDTCKK